MNKSTNGRKRSVRFSDVTVYYFQRVQGFACVPSDPGATLGMKHLHNGEEKFSLVKYDYLRDWEEACEENKMYNRMLDERAMGRDTREYEWTMNMIKNRKKARGKGPVYPLSSRQRAFKLRSAGVDCIDPTERDEINRIRDSRVVCGCNCADGCVSACPCSEAGVPCQVERTNGQSSYPCSCGPTGCENQSGRIEFDLDGIKTFVHRTIEKTRDESENPEILEQPPRIEDIPQILFSITMDDFEKADPNGINPIPEVFCNEHVFLSTMNDPRILDCEIYDCGCSKVDPNVESCPNCTCQPMDVAMTPEVKNNIKNNVKNDDEEDEEDDIVEEKEEICTGCNQTPCISITKMMTNFRQLTIVNDTCNKGTMTTPWPWYEDLEEEITGEKGPSAMIVDPSNCRKRFFDELEQAEVNSTNANDFQQRFQWFVVNSRRKVSARVRMSLKTKESSLLEITTALVPSPNSEFTPQNDLKHSRSEFTVIKSHKTFGSNQEDCSQDKPRPPLSDVKILSSSGCEVPGLITNLSNPLQINEPSHLNHASEPDKSIQATDLSTSPAIRSDYSQNRLRPKKITPKHHATMNHLKDHIIKKGLKWGKPGLPGRHSKLSPASTLLETPSSNTLCLVEKSSKLLKSDDPFLTSDTDDLKKTFVCLAKHSLLSAENFFSNLQSLIFSAKSGEGQNSTSELNQVQFGGSTSSQNSDILPKSLSSSLSSLSSNQNQEPSLSDLIQWKSSSSAQNQETSSSSQENFPSPASIFSSSLDINSTSSSNTGSFVTSITTVNKLDRQVFSQTSGIWKSAVDDSKTPNFSLQFVEHFIQDIHHRISGFSKSEMDCPNNSLKDVPVKSTPS